MVPWDPEGLEDPFPLDGQEHQILSPLSVRSHQGLLVHLFLQESPWDLAPLSVPVVQVFLTQKFPQDLGFQVALVGPGVLANRLGQHLLSVLVVLSPLVFLGVLANLAFRWPIVLVGLAALALLADQDFRGLVFLVVQKDLGVLEVQQDLVVQGLLALLSLVYLKDAQHTTQREQLVTLMIVVSQSQLR